MAATVAAITRMAPRMYFLAENHDCGSSPVLKTKFCAGESVVSFSAVTWGASGAGSPELIEPSTPMVVTSLGSITSGMVAVRLGIVADRKTVCTLVEVGVAAAVAAGMVGRGNDCGRFSCPRHFFSSHSTHKARPAETGKPHASHLRKLRKTGGTEVGSDPAIG
jgi:hypothetical protein